MGIFYDFTFTKLTTRVLHSATREYLVQATHQFFTDLNSSLVMYLSEDLEVVSDVFQVFQIGHHFGQGPGHLVEVLPQWVLDRMVRLGVEATPLPLGNRSIGVQIWGVEKS